jgi:hypothetical protein
VIDRIFLTHPQVAKIIEDRRAATTERAKSMLEGRLWAITTPAIKREYRVENFLKELFGPGSYSRRRCLLNAPDELWDRVDGGSLTLAMAEWIWLQARKASRREERPAAEFVPDLLARLDKAPVKSSAGGRTVKHRPKSAKRPKVTKDTTAGDNFRSAWTRIRMELRRMLEKRANGLLDSIEGDRLMTAFERELDATIQGFTRRIAGLKRQDQKPISRRKLIDACRVLHMDPPEPGGGVDLAMATRQKRRLARAYHPDAAGDASMTDQYQAVIEAFETIDAYSAGVGGKTEKGDEHGDNGGKDATQG